MSVLTKLADYLQQARQAQQQTGVSPLRQWRELLRLRSSPGRIGPGDYYTYRLFEPDLSLAQKAEFAGWQTEAVLNSLNDRSWHSLGLDKVLTTELMAAQGLRCTQTHAVYLPGRERLLQQAQALRTKVELQQWLREPAHYPFFGKPAASGFGRGACFATGYEASSDCLLLRDGERLAVEAFAHDGFDHEKLGYLFQQPVEPDPRLRAALGDIVTSLRVMVLCDDTQAPQIHRVFWKLPTGANMNDNFNDGRSGNLAAAIDAGSGRITRVINGSGLQLRDVRQHPDSGVDLHGVSVPDWPAVQAFVLRAALIFPKLRFQQWDIALSEQGPLALELNLFCTGGGDLSQLLYRRGLLDTTMLGFLRRQGLMA